MLSLAASPVVDVRFADATFAHEMVIGCENELLAPGGYSPFLVKCKLFPVDAASHRH